MLQVALHVIIVWIAESISFLLLASIIPGFELDSWQSAVAGVAVFGLLNALARPILLRLALPFTVLSFGLVSLALNGLMLAVAAEIVPGMYLEGGWTLVLVVLGLSLTSTIASGILSLNDESSFYYHVVRRARRNTHETARSSEPGLIAIEIDGLAEPMVRQAIEQGDMPHLAELINSGKSKLIGWDTGLPSQTSAAQSGILFGNAFNIPAFRWYEKDEQRLMVSSRPTVASIIEERVEGGEGGLLHPYGSSISNIVSGGAARTVMTLSSLSVRPGQVREQSQDFYLYFLNPYNFGRAFVFTLKEIAVEVFQGLRQRIRNERPRVGRGGSFPLLRAVSTVLLRDITTSLVIEDVVAGTPAVYATFLGYDVVAHHAGPFNSDVRGPLREIDRAISRIEHAFTDAPRPYRLVVLSDHGQSHGATFRQRFGESLEDLVKRLVSRETAVSALSGDPESEQWGYVNALLNEVLSDDRPVTRVARRAFRRRRAGDTIEVGPERETDVPLPTPPDIQVCASGNLGLIYFPKVPRRMTLEEIEERFPGLVAALAAHPGIGLVMVRSERYGSLAIGARGIRHLANDVVDGADPLAPFGPCAARHLAQLDQYPDCGDIVVNSMLDPETGEVAAFEELVGSHGGLGGPQTSAFLLIPAEWDAGSDGKPVTGPDAVFRMLRQAVPNQ